MCRGDGVEDCFESVRVVQSPENTGFRPFLQRRRVVFVFVG